LQTHCAASSGISLKGSGGDDFSPGQDKDRDFIGERGARDRAGELAATVLAGPTNIGAVV
jgi:hypothetical protein